MPVYTVCELAPKSLFYTTNEGNEIPEVTFEINKDLGATSQTVFTGGRFRLWRRLAIGLCSEIEL